MNESKELRNSPGFWLIGFAFAMLVAPGCSTSDPNTALSNLAGDLARQVVTWWLF